MKTTHTTCVTAYSEDDGSRVYLVSVDGGDPERISAERAELIIEQRKADGWSKWREIRDSKGRLSDALYLLTLD